MRYAFHLKIAKGKEKMYDERHKNVCQDLLSTLKNAGVKNYSIFRDGTDIFGYWECDNLSGTLSSINNSSSNDNWQKFMSDVIQTPSEKRTGEGMKEVFHLD